MFSDYILLGVFSTSLYYLLAHARITQWLWSKYRGWLRELSDCPACSGFWLGGIVWVYLLELFDLENLYQTCRVFIEGGLLGVFLVPLFFYVQTYCLSAVGFDNPNESDQE